MVAEKVGDTASVELTDVENELYDRQIRLWGVESQKRLRSAKVLVSGINGLGAEITKNLILSGVHSVTLHDEKVVSKEDFCSQFLVPRESLGINRAVASIERARLLNPMVKISADTDPLESKTEAFIGQFDVIVISGAKESELIRIDNICRAKNIMLFSGDVWGTFGYFCADLQVHSFAEDVLKHKIVTEPNRKPKTELITTTRQTEIEFPPLEAVFDYKFVADAHKNDLKRRGPGFIILRILQKFRKENNRDPTCQSREEDSAQLVNIRDEFCSEDVVPASWFLNVFNQISPAAAIIGGVLTQEIIKAISKKEAPVRNLFLFDPERSCGFIELVPANYKPCQI